MENWKEHDAIIKDSVPAKRKSAWNSIIPPIPYESLLTGFTVLCIVIDFNPLHIFLGDGGYAAS